MLYRFIKISVCYKYFPMGHSLEDNDLSDILNEEPQIDVFDIERAENEVADKSLGGGLKKIKLTKSAAIPKSSGSTINKTKYPKMEAMIKESILALNDRKGSSAHAIHKYIKSKWPTDDEKRRAIYLKKSLKACAVKGDLEQVRLSFKVSAKWKKSEQDKKTTERKSEKMEVKNIKAKEKKSSQEKKEKKEKTRKTIEKKPLKDKQTDSIKPKPSTKSKVATKKFGQAVEEVTTKKTSEKKQLGKKVKIRKSIGTLRPDVAKPLVKSVKKMVAGGKSGKKKAAKEVLSESSDKENTQFGLEPKRAVSRTKNVYEKSKGKNANPPMRKIE